MSQVARSHNMIQVLPQRDLMKPISPRPCAHALRFRASSTLLSETWVDPIVRCRYTFARFSPRFTSEYRYLWSKDQTSSTPRSWCPRLFNFLPLRKRLSTLIFSHADSDQSFYRHAGVRVRLHKRVFRSSISIYAMKRSNDHNLLDRWLWDVFGCS